MENVKCDGYGPGEVWCARASEGLGGTAVWYCRVWIGDLWYRFVIVCYTEEKNVPIFWSFSVFLRYR